MFGEFANKIPYHIPCQQKLRRVLTERLYILLAPTHYSDADQPELGGCTNVKMASTSQEYNSRLGLSSAKI